MAKSPSRQVTAATPKIKTSVTLSARAFRRLSACVAREGLSQSEVVELLINDHLAGYTIQVAGKRIGAARGRSDESASVESNDRLAATGEVSDPGATAA